MWINQARRCGVSRGGCAPGALLMAWALMTILASGCAELSELPVSGESSPEQEYSYTRVIDLLLEGEADRAESLLRARLEQAPGDAKARALLRQVEDDPEAFLGSDSFEYEVQPGESLSVLAQRFLGDHRLFFILARYNDIATPSLVQAGQTLRIPSDYWDGPAPSREPLDREIRAREYLADDRPGDALAMYRDVETAALGRDELTVLGTAHRRWLEKALDDDDLENARERLTAARRDAPDDGSWSDWLDALSARVSAESAFHTAVSLRDDDPAAAARALRRALQADPGHAEARQALAEMRRELVPELHREAVILYRHQDLEEAIRLWNRVLEIDPEFEPALGYRSRATELKRRLEALN
ncbi:MAG TPA: tetratricopeptide repeat protein [Arenicellales bacterium]|nr:tetratricopeptide repeat protein [Arenicellales bacterium]